ncbi:anti-sigma factor domain-containing protein [Streptomyces sp. NPDC059718]
MTSTDPHALTGAHALHALTDHEARAFRRHLARCATCTLEVREFHETAARLALATAEKPPPSLHTRVAAALPRTRQLPPRTAQGITNPLRRLRRRPTLPHLAAAACLVTAVVLGGWAVHAQHAVEGQRARAIQLERHSATLAALMTDPRAAFHTTDLAGGGTATVVVSSGRNQAALLYTALPALPDSRVYQLWYSKNGTMHSAGLLAPGRPTGAELLTGTPQGAEAVGITAEPQGGSPTPTARPLAIVTL